MLLNNPGGSPAERGFPGSTGAASAQPTSLSGLRGGASLAQMTQIPRPAVRWKTRILVPMLIGVSALALAAYAARDVLTPAMDVYVVPVVVSPTGTPEPIEADADAPSASRSPGSVLVQAPGWIEPGPYPINVPSLVDGVVSELLALEGQHVEAGQIVATLIDEDLRLKEQAAAAALAEREAALALAKAQVAPARAAVQVAQANQDEVRDQVERNRELVPKGGFSAGEYRRLEIRLQGLEAGVVQAQAEVEAAEAGVLSAEAAVASARVALAEAALSLSRTKVRAPASGVVMTRLVEPGSRMMISSSAADPTISGTVLKLYDPLKLQVRVDVPLAEAGKVGVGTRARITTEVLPDLTFDGVVTRVVHEANIQRNTVQFKVSIVNPSPLLKPEMLSRVRFVSAPTGSGEAAGGAGEPPTPGGSTSRLVLPRAVLQNINRNKASVWLVESGRRPTETTAALIEVTIGSGDGEAIAILSGLRPGDRVISNPPGALKHGARVRVVGEAPVQEESSQEAVHAAH